MTQPARGYQPYQPMAPMMGAPTPPKQSRGGLTTLLAGVLALVIAGLAVGSTFASITDYRNSYEIDGDPSVYATSTTWWGFLDAGSSSPVEEESILAGLTLVLAGALLLIGAVFAFVAARTRKSGPVAGARSLISAGVGVLAGVTLLQLIAVVRQMQTYNEQELDAGESLEFTAGLGLWLPLGGIVLGIVAVVLAHVGQRPAAARVEPNTPRMGFPAPYGYRPQASRTAEVHIPDEVASADTQVVSGATVSGADASEQLTSPNVGSEATPASGSPAGSTPAAGSPAAGPAAAAPAAPVAPPAPIAPPAAPVVPAAAPTPASAAAPQAESAASPDESATPAAAPQADATPAEPAASPAAAPQADSATPKFEPTPAAAPQAESTTSPAEPAAPAAAPQADATPADAAPAASPAPAVVPQGDAAPATPPAAAPAASPAKPEAPAKPDPEPEAAKSEAAKPTPLSELPAAPPAPELSSPDDKSK